MLWSIWFVLKTLRERGSKCAKTHTAWTQSVSCHIFWYSNGRYSNDNSRILPKRDAHFFLCKIRTSMIARIPCFDLLGRLPGTSSFLAASSFRNVNGVWKRTALWPKAPAAIAAEYWIFLRIRHFYFHSATTWLCVPVAVRRTITPRYSQTSSPVLATLVKV